MRIISILLAVSSSHTSSGSRTGCRTTMPIGDRRRSGRVALLLLAHHHVECGTSSWSLPPPYYSCSYLLLVVVLLLWFSIVTSITIMYTLYMALAFSTMLVIPGSCECHIIILIHLVLLLKKCNDVIHYYQHTTTTFFVSSLSFWSQHHEAKHDWAWC